MTQRIFNLLTCVSLLLFSVPLLVLPNDFWDAALVSFIFDIGDLRGLKALYADSGWHLQNYLYRVVYFTTKTTGISEELILKFLIICSVYGVSVETRHYGINNLNLSNKASQFSQILVILYPVWFVFTSHVMVMHILCTFLVLSGYRQVMVNKKYVLGFSMMLLSLQLQSNFAFIIGLLLVDYIRCQNHFTRNKNIHFAIYSIGMVTLYILTRPLFEAVGEYAGYNKLTFDLTKLKSIIGAFIYFSLFLITLLSIPLFLSIQKLCKPVESETTKKVFCLLILIFFAILPYALLGKSPALPDLYDWRYRQCILLSIPISILIAWLLEAPTEKFNIKHWFVLTVSIIFLYIGYAHKWSARFHLNSIAKSLEEIELPDSGLVSVAVLNAQTGYIDNIRPYEMNVLFYKLYGKANWLTTSIQKDTVNPNFTLQPWQLNALAHELEGLKYAAMHISSNCKIQLTLVKKQENSLEDIILNEYEDIYQVSINIDNRGNCSQH